MSDEAGLAEKRVNKNASGVTQEEGGNLGDDLFVKEDVTNNSKPQLTSGVSKSALMFEEDNNQAEEESKEAFKASFLVVRVYACFSMHDSLVIPIDMEIPHFLMCNEMI